MNELINNIICFKIASCLNYILCNFIFYFFKEKWKNTINYALNL